MNQIPEEQKNKALIYYRNRSMKIEEISNMTNISISVLTKLYREAFKNKTLKPRKPDKALTPRTPAGMGKHYVPSGIGYGGRNKERKKFSDEQEQQIAEEYYTTSITYKEIMAKYQMHPVQMQRIRNKFAEQYGGEKKTTLRGRPQKQKINEQTKE